MPEGRADPLAKEYVIVESESKATADKFTETSSIKVPRDPDGVCHIGDSLIYIAYGSRPNKLDVFVTFRS